MKTSATKEKRSAPATRKARPYVHHPMGPVQLAQRAEIHRILRSTGAQAKLTVGEPNDKYEQEADRVADRVMRMSNADVAQQVETGRIQRMCSECEAEQALQRQPIEEEEEILQTKPLADQITPLVQRQVEPEEEEEELLQSKEASGPKPELTPDAQTQIDAIRGTGQPLPESVRKYFEPRFGMDFRGVRIHDGNKAADVTKAVNAKAFTLGRDVVLGAGQYAPGTFEGRKLLGHELTHVVQQSDQHSGYAGVAPCTVIQRQAGGGTGSKPLDPCKFPYFTGMYGLNMNGKTWYPHDYKGPLLKEENPDVAKSSSEGYKVPRSSTSRYNCMGWALCHGESTASNLQGVPRDSSHPWPEEKFMVNKGCKKISAADSAKHKAKLYEYNNEDQFHIVREENDSLWSAKTGAGPLYRGTKDPDAHTTSVYSRALNTFRITYWSCP